MSELDASVLARRTPSVRFRQVFDRGVSHVDDVALGRDELKLLDVVDRQTVLCKARRQQLASTIQHLEGTNDSSATRSRLAIEMSRVLELHRSGACSPPSVKPATPTPDTRPPGTPTPLPSRYEYTSSQILLCGRDSASVLHTCPRRYAPGPDLHRRSAGVVDDLVEPFHGDQDSSRRACELVELVTAAFDAKGDPRRADGLDLQTRNVGQSNKHGVWGGLLRARRLEPWPGTRRIPGRRRSWPSNGTRRRRNQDSLIRGFLQHRDRDRRAGKHVRG